MTKTLEVFLLDDPHEEGEEAFTQALFERVGSVAAGRQGNRHVREREPDGRRSYLARFGRTTAEPVVQHVEERMAAPRSRLPGAGSPGLVPAVHGAGPRHRLPWQFGQAMDAGSGAAPMGAAPMGAVSMDTHRWRWGSHKGGRRIPATGAGVTGMKGLMGDGSAGAARRRR